MSSSRLFWSTFVVGGALLWTPISCQRQVEFFYSPQNDTCAYGGQSYEADGNSNNGGVCAWAPADSRVYACPAPDPTCWAWDQTCGGGTTAAGAGQILCESGSYSWCCLDSETCTTTEGQVNICISDFSSPNSGVSAGTAEAAELQALGVVSVSAAVETASPSIFSTRTVDSNGALYTSSSPTSTSATGSTITGSSTQISTTSGSGSRTSGPSASATRSDTPAASSISSASSSSGLSAGAAAGIAVGVIAAFAIGALIVWAVMRRRSRTSTVPPNETHHHALGKETYPVYTSPDMKAFSPSSGYQHQYQRPVHEADALNIPRTELPSNLSHSELP